MIAFDICPVHSCVLIDYYFVMTNNAVVALALNQLHSIDDAIVADFAVDIVIMIRLPTFPKSTRIRCLDVW